jgi:hypothetical protein
MISTTATPPKAGKVRCLDCGMEARSPIVVEIGKRTENKTGRCADRKACAMRQRREANRAKQKPE